MTLEPLRDLERFAAGWGFKLGLLEGRRSLMVASLFRKTRPVPLTVMNSLFNLMNVAGVCSPPALAGRVEP